ncbi:MAG TPA: hypothetical protein VFI57_05320, partial [Pyrinomonadaceae bacterium]|nr:hypothetical protein [Pyrinomonadaceae bacterium]
MILREYEIYDALRFRQLLGRAIKGVVRITAEGGSQTPTSLATGWLITDTLVVICDYVLTVTPSVSQMNYFCHLSPMRFGRAPRPEARIAADPVEDLPGGVGAVARG